MADVKLPESMKAQFLDAFNTPYNLRSTPLPKPTSKHDLLIKVDAASYCQFVPTFITTLPKLRKLTLSQAQMPSSPQVK